MSNINHSQQLWKLLQSEKSLFIKKHDGVEIEDSMEKVGVGSQPITDPDFICFFLSFLRETSSNVLKKPLENCFLHQTSNASCKNLSAVSHKGSPSGGTQMMSTPKFRDDVATPKSCHNFHLKSPNYSHNIQTCAKTHPKSASFCQGYSSTDQCKNSKSGHKYSNKPLSLSDFLSPEAGHSTAYGSAKRRPQKQRPQKAKRITPADRPFQHHTKSNFVSGNEFSHSSDIKSPVNPLYSEASRTISFDIDEEFPSLSLASLQTVQTKPTRRIKPTTVTVDTVSLIKDSEKSSYPARSSMNESDSQNPFISAQPVNPSLTHDLNEERNLLLNMKKTDKKQRIEANKNLTTPVKSLDNISPVKQTLTEPNPVNVFSADKLERLAHLYSYFINAFLVPSLIAELHFIVDLLTVNASREKKDNSGLMCMTGSLCNSSESNIEDAEEIASSSAILLSTAENCVFFAVGAISCLVQSGIISVLLRPTLSMLLQNSRIQCFMPALAVQISALVEKLEQKEKDLSLYDYYGSQERLLSLSCVPFQAETDDRSNFQSDKAFHAFRKHRDLFYAILREYEDKKTTNFDIQQQLGGKIKNLVFQVKSMVTYKPFVRLFVSQMLQGTNSVQNVTHTSCFTNGSYIDGDTTRTDLLSSLRHGDPEKFRRLQSRFVTASTSSSNVSKARDSISEQCHFYEEFITCADSFVLNIHLCNELRERICDIESQQVQQILDDALAESVNIATVSASLTNVISSARVLGRFFGYLTFLPYNTENSSVTSLDENIVKCLSSALDRASFNKHNLVTIPWVTEYLKSGNFASASSFKDVKEVIEKLFGVFRYHAFDCANSFSSGDFMMSLAISTLIEMQTFPDDSFYDLLKKYPRNAYSQNILDLCSVVYRKNEREMESTASLDECCIDLISVTMMYDWHPALREIRSNVVSSITGGRKVNASHQPPRKIKPNTEKKAEETIVQKKEKQLQFNLEEYFFRGQPSSLKRTVAFVAERSASNCVKHIRSISMLSICNEAEKIFKQRLKIGTADEEMGNSERVSLTRQVTSEMKAIAKNRMNEEADKFCERAVPQCMENLTSCETADGVLKVATKIAKKRAIANVHSWLNTRLDELVSVSVKARLTKVASRLAMTTNEIFLPKEVGVCEHTNHNLEIESLSSLLQIMKEYIVKLTFSNNPVSHSRFFVPSTIVPGICDEISEEKVSFLLSLSNSILDKDNEEIVYISNREKYNSMKKLISTSPHLKKSLILATKELSRRADSFFVTSWCNLLPALCDTKFTNMQSTYT